MPYTCAVAVDGSLTSRSHTFEVVPRIGDAIMIPEAGDVRPYYVKAVMHWDKSALEHGNDVSIFLDVSSRRD